MTGTKNKWSGLSETYYTDHAVSGVLDNTLFSVQIMESAACWTTLCLVYISWSQRRVGQHFV